MNHPAPPDDDLLLWQQAVAGARTLARDDRVSLRPDPPPPLPRQRQRDEQAALAASLSDALDVDTLLDTDADLSFRRPGISQAMVRKLRRGQWSIQAELDLHGMRRDEARTALLEFVQQAQRRGLRCVRVVHGKGLGSPGGESVLKRKTQVWLVQIDAVLAFCQARACDGGAGALLVLLRG